VRVVQVTAVTTTKGERPMKQAIYSIALLATVAGLLMISMPAYASEMDSRIESTARQSYVFTTYLQGDDIRIKSRDGDVTLTGTVAINSGTLFLAAGSSLSNASGVSIAGGATFDVSGLASPYVWPATGSVIASGTAATPAAINGAGAVTLSSGNAVVLTYDDTDAAPQPALNINGNLTLGGNAFTVNTADGKPLAAGTYVLIQTSGTITSMKPIINQVKPLMPLSKLVS